VKFHGRVPSPVLEKVYLHKAAAKGNAVALLLLGQIALQVDKNPQHAVRHWRAGARAGNAESALSLAYYFAVHGRSMHTSLRWFLDAWKLAQQADTERWIYDNTEFWPAVATERQHEQLLQIQEKLHQRDFELTDHAALMLRLIRWVRPYVEKYRRIYEPVDQV